MPIFQSDADPTIIAASQSGRSRQHQHRQNSPTRIAEDKVTCEFGCDLSHRRPYGRDMPRMMLMSGMGHGLP